MTNDYVRTALVVAGIFDRLDIPYFVADSVASSLLGEIRSTKDVDFVADLTEDRVDSFVAAMGADFYADDATIRDAIRRRASFNIIDLATMTKVDAFPIRDLHAREEMRRRRRTAIADSPVESLFLPTPEDIVLDKLEWYRRGGGVSDRQWRDLLGVLKAQADKLDLEYLEQWAESLDLSDLLARALAEAGIPQRPR
ncbi:MAG: hypothetical protein HYR85_04780 [Planctomycetes bacterium]|nr:hypothetical protein [Planctomycetota bacterium]